jgi:hypothetical protein
VKSDRAKAQRFVQPVLAHRLLICRRLFAKRNDPACVLAGSPSPNGIGEMGGKRSAREH